MRNTWLFGWLVLLAVLITPAVGWAQTPEEDLLAAYDDPMAKLEAKYLSGEIDESDPVVQALRWRQTPRVRIKLIGNPLFSLWLDPQYMPWELPWPVVPRVPELRVPPEVIAQFDPQVLANEKPTYAVITHDMIFDLRTGPSFNAHFVRFDFDLDELSKPQLEILSNWCRCGLNDIMLMGEEIAKYADFLGGQRAFFHSDLDRLPRLQVLACDHVMATDCAHVTVPFDWREVVLSRDFYWEGITATKVPSIEVFAYYLDEENMRLLSVQEEEDETPEDRWVAAYGRFKLEKTTVYFRPYHRAEGPDGDRFELNWAQWILNLKVPGPAATDVPCGGEPCPPAPVPATPCGQPTGNMILVQPATPCGQPAPAPTATPCGQPAPAPCNQPATMPMMTLTPAMTVPAAQPVAVQPTVIQPAQPVAQPVVEGGVMEVQAIEDTQSLPVYPDYNQSGDQ